VIKESLVSFQGVQKLRGLHRKGLAGRKEKERVLFSERAHKRVLTVKMKVHLILYSSTRALVTLAISTVSDRGLYCESMCPQMNTAHIPHSMLREVKVQIASWHRGGHPHSAPECVNQLEDLGGDRQFHLEHQQIIGAGVCILDTNRNHHVSPDSFNITNTIHRSELADFAAAVTHDYFSIGTRKKEEKKNYASSKKAAHIN